MNRSHGQSLVVQEVINQVALDLGVGEDYGTLRTIGENQIKKRLILHALVDIDDLLRDVLVRATHTTDLDAEVVCVHVFSSKSTGGLGEGGGEHEIRVVGIGVDVSRTC